MFVLASALFLGISVMADDSKDFPPPALCANQAVEIVKGINNGLYEGDMGTLTAVYDGSHLLSLETGDVQYDYTVSFSNSARKYLVSLGSAGSNFCPDLIQVKPVFELTRQSIHPASLEPCTCYSDSSCQLATGHSDNGPSFCGSTDMSYKYDFGGGGCQPLH